MNAPDLYDALARALGVTREEARTYFTGKVRIEVERVRAEESSAVLPEGFHGRWNELSLEDCKMLCKMGIEIDS